MRVKDFISLSARDSIGQFAFNRMLGFSAICILLLSGMSSAQTPQPQPQQPINQPHLSLVPLVMLNVGLDNIAKPISSPTGVRFPTPEFLLPRNSAKTLDFTTSGGNINVSFSNSVPSGVPSSAFAWAQQTVPAGNAVGHLSYNGCTACPSSFTLSVTAASNTTVHAEVKLTLTVSTAKPVMSSVSRNGGDNVEPAFDIQFQRSTFDTADSTIVATYANGLKYRLIPQANSQFANGRMSVIVPRLDATRTVKISLVNPYGTSNESSIELPQQNTEDPSFECVNCSGEFPNSAHIGDTFSIKHSNGGITTVNGSDDISIQPLLSAPAGCNQRDYLHTGAKASWLDASEHPTSALGTVSVSTQPSLNAPLRSPNNRLHLTWTLNPFSSDKFYQVVYRGVTIVGTCSDRVIH